MELLRRNLGYKLLSLTLGILLYAVAEAQRNPRVSQDLLVTPSIEHVPANMAVRGEPSSISITVNGPARAIQSFRDQTIKAVLDLKGAHAGSNRLPVHYQNDPTLLDVSGQVYVDVMLEKKARTTFDVDVLYNNTPPPGFVYNDPVTDPRRVNVSGLASDVSRVDRIVAIVDNDDTGAISRRPVELVAQNIQHEVIDAVQIEPAQARVSITTRRTPSTKSLVLSARLSGMPAPGFALSGYHFDPPALTVSGEQAAIARLSSLNVPVSVSGLRSSVERRVTPSLPPGVTLSAGEPRAVGLQIDIDAVPTLAATPKPTPVPEQPNSMTTPVVVAPTPAPAERKP